MAVSLWAARIAQPNPFCIATKVGVDDLTVCKASYRGKAENFPGYSVQISDKIEKN
jgi:hypothetical protein